MDLSRGGELRIVVVGVTGSGKTTLARQISQLFGIPHIELDALHWQPGWVMTDLAVFREALEKAVSAPAWVVDGNYSKVRDIVWPSATMLLWLDYPLALVLFRLARRTVQRVISREILWNENCETMRGAFFSRDSLFLWALKSHKQHKQQYPILTSLPEYAHLDVVRLRSPQETAEWLQQVKTQ
jgi:adenylate kinase family enzyme